MSSRALPNLLVTGTPGTGKSTFVHRLVAEARGFRAIDVGELVKAKQLHEGWDEEYQTYVLDEDKLLDELEDEMEAGGVIIEYHGAELFPERWFDLVLVMRSDNGVLYSRLTSRGYSGKKLEDNIEAEIMQLILDEARESYREEIVVELQSNTVEDLDSNVERTLSWLQSRTANRAAGSAETPMEQSQPMDRCVM